MAKKKVESSEKVQKTVTAKKATSRVRKPAKSAATAPATPTATPTITPAAPVSVDVSSAAPKVTAKTPPVAKKQPLLEPVITLSHQQIAERAFAIWVAKGRPQGRDAENWRDAEEQLKAELLTK